MLSQLIETLLPVAKRFFPADPDKAASLAHEMALARMQADADVRKGQLEINRAEAQSRDLWTSGWRPSVGWSCSAALFFNYVALPLLKAIAAWQGHPFEMDPLDLSVMLPVLLGMLGLSGIRSHDKLKGLTK